MNSSCASNFFSISLKCLFSLEVSVSSFAIILSDFPDIELIVFNIFPKAESIESALLLMSLMIVCDLESTKSQTEEICDKIVPVFSFFSMTKAFISSRILSYSSCDSFNSHKISSKVSFTRSISSAVFLICSRKADSSPTLLVSISFCSTNLLRVSFVSF